MRDEDIFHDGLTDFYHVWTLAEAFLLDSMPLPAASLLRWLKMYCLSNENPDSRFELDEAEAAALEGTSLGHLKLRSIHPGGHGTHPRYSRGLRPVTTPLKSVLLGIIRRDVSMYYGIASRC